MATLHWVGSTDGNFGTQANWRDPDGSAASAAPSNNDTFVFDTGSVDVDAGLTTGLTGCTIKMTKGYKGRIAPNSALSIALVSLQVVDGSELNLTGNITSGTVRCATGNSFNYTGGTATTLNIINTPYTIQAAAVVTNFRTKNSTGADLNNATGYTTCKHLGGEHRTRRSGLFELGDGAMLRVMGAGSFANGTNKISGRSKVSYESGEDIGASVIVEVEPRSELDIGLSDSFTWSGTLRRWEDAMVNLYASAGLVTPSTVELIGVAEVSNGRSAFQGSF